MTSSNVRVNEELDTWEALTDAGRRASEDLDNGRWEVGDLACLVATQYGEDLIADFAKEIGQHKSTVQGYRRVANAFPKSVRVETFVKYPNLSYSHYKIAAGFEEAAKREEVLNEASASGWTVDETAHYLKKTPDDGDGNEKLIDVPKAIITALNHGCKVTFQLSPDQHGKLLDYWRDNRPVRLVVYAVPETLEDGQS